jgi:hypothetical protein
MGFQQPGPVVPMPTFDEPDEQDWDALHYLVEFTEPTLVEADAAYLWFSEQAGPDYAVR